MKIFLYRRISTRLTSKIILRMKLSILFFFTTLFSIHANPGYSQEAKLSLDLDNVPVERLLEEIESHSEFRFVYKIRDVDLKRVVSLRVQKEDIKSILDQVFDGTRTTYNVLDRQVFLLKRKKILRLEPVELLSRRDWFTEPVPVPQDTLSGIVMDLSGEPLIGVNVQVKGTTKGTATDFDGRFQLMDVDDGAVLVFSYIGFQRQELSVNARKSIEVTMIPDLALLDEIIVVGYGTMKKSDLTGAVSSVKSKDINAYPSTNVMQALSGRVPGVEVLQSTGAPGGPVNIRIRGTNSIMGGNEPLYVVDGVPISGQPSNLSNSDIQSIEVLKDASATAIYGSRGANSVVLITTKEGQIGETQVDFHAGYSVQSVRNKLDLLDASEYAQLHNEQAANDGLKPYFTPSEIDAFGGGTDWQNLLFQKAPLLNTSLTVSGGGEKTQFSVGASTFQQEGIIDGSDYNRYSFRTKFDHDIGEKFNLDISLNASRLKTGRKDSGGGSRGTSLFNSVITAPPTAKPYSSDGSITDFLSLHPFVSPDQVNPLYFINEQQRSIVANVLLGNASISYNPIPSITIKTLGGIENRDDRTDVYQTLNFRNSSGDANVGTSQFTSLLSENTLAFHPTFESAHDISAVTGFTYQNFLRTSLSAGSAGFLSDVFGTYNLGAGSTSGIPSSGYSQSTLLSYLARVNYSFDSRYLFTFSFRADGSSRFSEGNKWGYFPSGAFAWRLSEENFLKNQSTISNLKFRLSWGLTGNQAIQPYATLNQLQAGNTIFGDQLYTTFSPGTRLPSNLKWETTEQIDIGAEIGILQNRISFTADYYIKNTRDLLNTVGLPSSLGYTSTIQNVGSVQNKGLELGLDLYLIEKPSFKWNVYVSSAFNKNKVVELAGGKDILTSFVGILVLSDNVGILREGRPIGQFYGYMEDGYDESGKIKYQDLNGDGKITNLDKTYIGDPNPDLVFGLNSSMTFKNIDLTFFLQGATGNDIFNVNAASALDYGRGLNVQKNVLTNHWTPSNTQAEYPIISRSISAEASNRFIEDGSFMRLKNIELAYSFPFDKMIVNGVKRLQLYLSGQNLLTLTAYSWWDPEVNSKGIDSSRGIDHYSYPVSQSFTGGIRVGF